jgi:iron complex transport system substrate-binding protein
MKYQILSALSIVFLFVFGCHSSQTTSDERILHSTSDDYLQYAKGFKVTSFDDIKLVEIREPFKGDTQGLSYWLIPKGMTVPDSLSNKTIIRTPIESLVCTSTTHITPLDLLEESDKLIGFPSTQYISSEKVKSQVENGITREVGRDNNLNVEVLLDLSPEVLMTYSMTGDYSHLTPFERSGIKVIQNAEYLEETPLGRAEWIKFMALFFDKEKEADSIFQIIADSYNSTLKLVESQEKDPTVFSGIVYGDTWFMPGGRSWAGKFFKDSRADFLWKNTPESGSLELSFEAVFEKAYQADYWIGAANYYSLDALKGADQRYSRFEAFSKKQVFTYNARQIPNGGNDYFESGFTRPDIVLKDLVKIIHPDLMPEHMLYYYRKLD